MDDLELELESEIQLDGEIEVTAPSGAVLSVLTEKERDVFLDVSGRYLTDNIFTNITDLQDLDRILIMELMVVRWGTWLARERDYWGQEVDLEKIQKYLSDYSKEIRLVKKALGIDKGTRDRDKGASVADYIDQLRLRAKEFGVMRNNQAAKAIELFQELASLVTLHKNCIPEERRENNIEMEDLFEWIENIAIPEFNKIDAEFRETSQKYWVRTL
jgi:hypothetical protein